MQITAEQLLRESKERQAAEVKTPVQKIQNSEVFIIERIVHLLGIVGMAILEEARILKCN